MKKTMIAIVSLLLLSGACWSDDMEMNDNEAKYYDNAKVVRIKSVEGEGFVQRSYDEGKEEATANLPLFEKDTVGTTEGRLEIYLGRMNYLRLDADSVAVLEQIPQLRKTDLSVRLDQGSIYLDIESMDQEKSIEIQTPDCGIFLLANGVYRVNLMEGRSEVIVLEGIAEVAGRENSSNVRENQMIVMERGETVERPFYFSAADKDDFDRWNESQNREQGYARFGTSRYLQSGYEDYEYEMSRAGRWSYMSDLGSYAWMPYNTYADWRPYSNGRWVWNPHYGYVWTSYDNCGWFTHHYGRWHWSYNQGWCWLPSYHWSPAWVSWFGNDSYYGWSPLSRWNRPIVIINNRWDRHYDYRHGIPHHSRSTIIIRKNEISSANIHRVALQRGALGADANGTLSYRGVAPSDRPAIRKVSVINAKGKTVTYKQSGIVSAEKYRAQGADINNAVYKYDQANSGGKVFRSKSGGGSASGESGAVFRSRSGEGSGSVNRVRYSPSGSSSEKAAGKSGYRSKSDGAIRRTTTKSSSTTSSSTSGSSSGTVKKKKGGTSYLSTRSGSSAGEASTTRYVGYSSAAGTIYRSGSTGTVGTAGNSSYRKITPASDRVYRSGTSSGLNSPTNSSSTAYGTVNKSSYRTTSPAVRSQYRSDYSGSSYSPANSNNSGTVGQSSYRATTPVLRREYRSNYSASSYPPASSSSGAYGTVNKSSYRTTSPAVRSEYRSSASGSVQRSASSSSSGSSHRSSSSSGSSRSSASSSSSSSSSRTAIKKK